MVWMLTAMVWMLRGVKGGALVSASLIGHLQTIAVILHLTSDSYLCGALRPGWLPACHLQHRASDGPNVGGDAVPPLPDHFGRHPEGAPLEAARAAHVLHHLCVARFSQVELPAESDCNLEAARAAHVLHHLCLARFSYLFSQQGLKTFKNLEAARVAHVLHHLGSQTLAHEKGVANAKYPVRHHT
eukprot:1072111-Prorocentrum_minimum.AAC.1